MTEPRTAAGRALLDDMDTGPKPKKRWPDSERIQWETWDNARAIVTGSLPAIEAEARVGLEERVEELAAALRSVEISDIIAWHRMEVIADTPWEVDDPSREETAGYADDMRMELAGAILQALREARARG